MARPQGAWTGDDQYREPRIEGADHVPGGHQPHNEGEQGQDQDRGDEDAADAVGQPLDRGLLTRGALNQVNQLGQGSVLGAAGGANGQAPVDREGAAQHLGPGLGRGQGGLAGHGAGIQPSETVDKLTIGRDLLRGTNHEQVVNLQVIDRDGGLRTVGLEPIH